MVMNWLNKLFKRHNPAPEFNLNDPANWQSNLSWRQSAGYGAGVGPKESMGLPAVYSAVRLISETAASLPLHVYRRTKKGREKAVERPVYRVLHDEPNPNMTSFVLRELWSQQLLLQGNAFGLVIRDGSGQVVRIDWLDATRVKRDPERPFYWYTSKPGVIEVFKADEVIHIPGPGSVDGVMGQSVIAYARNTIWAGLAASQFGGQFFANAARPGLAIELPEGVEMNTDERREFKAAFKAGHAGLSNVGKTVIVPGGAVLKTISIPAREAQYVESMKFNLGDIARAFRLPPHMLGGMDGAIKANIEEQGIDFVRHSMRPWLIRIEQELNRKLFRGSAFYVEHNIDGLMRGNFKSRMEGYAVAKTHGIYTTNMILAKENEDSIGPKGDIFTVQGQMKPLELLEREAKEAKKPAPVPPPDPAPADDDAVADAFSRSIAERLAAKERRSFANGAKSKDYEKWLDKFLGDHRNLVERELRGLAGSLADGVADEVVTDLVAAKAMAYVEGLRGAAAGTGGAVWLAENRTASPTWTVQQIRDFFNEKRHRTSGGG